MQNATDVNRHRPRASGNASASARFLLPSVSFSSFCPSPNLARLCGNAREPRGARGHGNPIRICVTGNLRSLALITGA